MALCAGLCSQHATASFGDRHLSVMAVALSACWLGVRRFLLCIEAFDVVPHSSHRRPAPSSHRSPYLALLLALLLASRVACGAGLLSGKLGKGFFLRSMPPSRRA